MAFVVPLVVAYASGAAAAVVAGTATFAAYATVAGAVMSSVGMLTKNKTLTKLGSIVGIVGGVAGMATGMSNAAAGAAGDAAGAAAGDAVADAAGSAASEGATEALKNEMANSAVGETIGATGGQSAGQVAGATEASNLGGAPLSLGDQSTNIMDQARAASGSDYGLLARNTAGSPGYINRIAEAGAQIKDKSVLESLLDKMNGAAKWVKDNKEIAQVGGQMLAGGMQAYQQGQQFDAQMNLLEQRRRRLNQPVVMGIQPLQLNTITPGG